MTKKEKKETKQEEVQETTEHAQEEVEISREDQLLNDLKRTHAEFENYRKRVERDRSEHSKLATKRLVIDLIDVLDNFSVSLEHKDNPEEFIKGTEMIYAQLLRRRI